MYQYASAARNLNEYDTPKKKQVKQAKPKKSQKLSQQKMIEKETKTAKRNFVILVVVILTCVLCIVYRNVLINQSFSEVQTLTKEISSIEKENSQISVNIQNSLNLSTIESLASTTLGMQKLSNKQTIYISLDTKDYVEVTTDQSSTEEEEGVIKTLWNKFLDLF